MNDKLIKLKKGICICGTALFLGASIINVIPVSAASLDSDIDYSTSDVENYVEDLSELIEEYSYVEDQNSTASEEFETGRLVVTLSEDAPRRADRKIEQTDDAIEEVILGVDDTCIVQCDSAEAAEELCEELEALDYVESVEPDLIIEADYTSWGYESSSTYAGATNMGTFYNTYRSSFSNNVVVAVLDTGVNPYNYILSGRVMSYGADATGGNNPYDDTNGHGTHCAGIIADGTNSKVTILPVKVMTGGSGYSTWLQAGIQYAISQNVDVISMSLGMPGHLSYIDAVVTDALNHNIVVVAAAGNESEPAMNQSPCNIDGVIGVGAIDSNGNVCSFSNYGAGVDIYAPGQSITSASNTNQIGTRSMSGTSQATPHVAAAAALIKSYNKSYSCAQVLMILQNSAASMPNSTASTVIGGVTYSAPKLLLSTTTLSGGGGNQNNSPVSGVSVSYRTHVQNVGWQAWSSNGGMSGTSGQSLRLEAIEISVSSSYNLGVVYNTHVQDYGWRCPSANGIMSGTSGESKRLEAIQITLTGSDAGLFDIYYRVHAQDYGWLGWAKNGECAGTAGYAKRLEGIQIVIVPKGTSMPNTYLGISSASSSAYVTSGAACPSLPTGTYLSYTTHVQNIGWQGAVSTGAVSGTSGLSYRLEGITISLENQQYSGDIYYRTHVQNIGWQNYVADGAMSGTSGQSLRLEAIQIYLTGEMANQYDIYYRVHAQNFGWLGWAKNGEEAGTAGFAYRLEAIQIVLVPKGSGVPASNYGGISENYSCRFISQ